eukprot:7861437-Lingulodinium_polyedra.AAC.1
MSFGEMKGGASDEGIVFTLQQDAAEGPSHHQEAVGMTQTTPIGTPEFEDKEEEKMAFEGERGGQEPLGSRGRAGFEATKPADADSVAE